MDYCGDPKIFTYGKESDLNILGGQPEMDAGVYNSAHISLWAYSGWWGNTLAKEPAQKMTSRLEEIERTTLTNKVRANAEVLAGEALAWLVKSGMAKKVTQSASLPSVGKLGLEVVVTQPSGNTTRYGINWTEHGINGGVI